MSDKKLIEKKELDDSWLIQRLQKPSTWNIAGKEIDNPFSFGGGLKNGGLSDGAMDLIRGIFSFDYMGSAEFEFGAVPQALSFIAKQATKKNLVASSVSVGKDETVYYITPAEWEDGVIGRIKELRKKWGGNIRLKHGCGLDSYFDNDSEYAKRNVGWLELDNGFAFFVDKEMFIKFSALMGVEASA